MLKALNIQLGILVIHGSLAFCLGLALLYLRATITNHIFEAIAVVIAILLATTALVLGALADWFAAWGEGTKHLQRCVFYLLSGLAFATAGALIGIYEPISMQWLILLAAIHALAFGVLGLVIAVRARRHDWERLAVFVFGVISIAFSGSMAGLARQLTNRNAMGILGLYFCFVAVKLFFLAWNLHQQMTMGGSSLDSENTHNLPFGLPSSPSLLKH
ncbi:MAG TPA: hypothetical protein VE178_11325 [Silvibacterium sp.]|jgi:hypothetical protein|nr:hypothetical protein [Silvibacterium sp.]